MALAYKKYVLFILCTFFSLYFLSVLWLFTGYYSPQKDTLWIDSLYQKKEAFARSIKGPKIVIVAGSSGLFGISAAQIEAHFKAPTVNLCTHAGLRDYYLNRAKKSINSGDLVIFAPEYAQYLFNIPMSRIKADYIINFDKPGFKNLPLNEKLYILKSYAHPRVIVEAKIKEFENKNPARKNVGYNARNLNRNGDETSNIGTKEIFIEPISINRGFGANEYGMIKISEFLDWCNKEGVKVIVTWPGMLPFKESPRNFNIKFIDSLIAFLSNSGIEVLGKPEDFFVPRNYLFDTIYHLNTDGVSHITGKTIRLLEKSEAFTSWYTNGRNEFDSVKSTFHPTQLLEVCLNGSMEKNDNNKPLGWKTVIGKKCNPDGISLWDNSVAYKGNYSLKLENTNSGQVRWLGEKVLLPQGTHMLHVGGWSKAENIEEHTRYCINLKTFFKDGSFKWNTRELNFSTGTHDWTKVQTVFSFDEEVTAVQPFLMLHGGTGTAWFDEIFIRISSKEINGK